MRSPQGGNSVKHRQTGSHWGVFTAEVRDGRLVGVQPHAKDPNPTPIINGIPEAVYGATRIRQPYVRKGYLESGVGSDRSGRGVEPFVPVSWDLALDLVAAEIRRLRSSYGNESIFAGSYGWASAGWFHHACSQLHRFLNGYGGFVDQVTTYSFGAAEVLLPHIVGNAKPVWGPTTDWNSIIRNTRLMVMFGGAPLKNTQLDHGGPMEHNAASQLKQARDAGIEFIYVGPVRDDMARFLDAQWLPARPGSDVAIMLALAHTLVSEGLHDRRFLARYCVGFERFLPYLMGETDGQPKSAEWAAPIAELEADTIRRLARQMAATRTLLTLSWSLQRGDHGEQTYWVAIALAAMLGQIGLPGGGFGFGYGSVNGAGNPQPQVRGLRLPTGANPVSAFIPVARISDMLLHPGEPFDFNGRKMTYPHARMVYWCGGNPFHHHQDINRLLHAWRRPETIVIQDPWWTSSARHADIVLPAVTTLERNDIGGSRLGRHFFTMPAVIDPVGEARRDFDIFADLADRLGFRHSFTEGRSEMEWLRRLYDLTRAQVAQQGLDMPEFDGFWETGSLEFPVPDRPFVMFEDFRLDPERHALRTPSGKIEIFSETIASFGYDDCRGHPAWMEPIEWLGSGKALVYPLHLISNQPKTRLHSQLDSCGISRASKVAGREPVRINPADATARGLREGDVVRIFNDRGACLAGLVISDDIRPGVVQISTGAWYDPLVPGGIGSLDRHGNPNMLTLDKGASKLTQAPIAHSALVEIERYDAELPEITVFSAPAMVSS